MSDKRTSVDIDLDDEVLFQLMLLAHKRDITLNQLVESILREYIDSEEPIQPDDQLTGC